MSGLKIIDGTPTAMSKYLIDKDKNKPLNNHKLLYEEGYKKAINDILEIINKFYGQSFAVNTTLDTIKRKIGEKNAIKYC